MLPHGTWASGISVALCMHNKLFAYVYFSYCTNKRVVHATSLIMHSVFPPPRFSSGNRDLEDFAIALSYLAPQVEFVSPQLGTLSLKESARPSTVFILQIRITFIWYLTDFGGPEGMSYSLIRFTANLLFHFRIGTERRQCER